MSIKPILWTSVLGLLMAQGLAGCESGRNELTGGVTTKVVAPGESDQAIDGPFQFNEEWRTISFEPSLKVDGSGRQVFGIALKPSDYKPLALIDQQESEQREDLDSETPFGSRGWLPERLKDGKVIKPEVELITTEDERVQLGVTGITQFGRGFNASTSYEFRVLHDTNTATELGQGKFPPKHRYKAVRIRANEPLEVHFLAWYSIPEDGLTDE